MSDRIALTMRDGSKRFIPGHVDLMELFVQAMRLAYFERHNGPKPTITYAEELAWIKNSIMDDEQQGHLVSGSRTVLQSHAVVNADDGADGH